MWKHWSHKKPAPVLASTSVVRADPRPSAAHPIFTTSLVNIYSHYTQHNTLGPSYVLERDYIRRAQLKPDVTR